MASIPWLADVLRAAGVRVVEEGNWLSRGVSGSFNPIGVLWHHTAATSSPSNPAPALNICINGRTDLQGPLCHALVDYNGVFHLISANRANHAGVCGGSGPIPYGDGNTMLIGWEIDYNGVSQEMTSVQYWASVIATAAVLNRLGRDASYVRGHRETSVTGKIDPSFINLDGMRGDVAAMKRNLPYGAIGARYQAIGGAGSVLGIPVGPESDAAWGGRWQQFQNGIMLWHPNTGAWEIYGDILRRFRDNGSEWVMTYPTGGEGDAAWGGRWQPYQDGIALWHGTIGAHWIHGAIFALFRELGNEHVLGYATSEEADGGQSPAGHGGRYQFFQNRLLLWSGATGAHSVYGGILAQFQALGNERVLGYPTSEEADWPEGGGRVQTFEHATIYWTPTEGARVEPN
jgi:LGFP repeat/N-acetylmuramoyl-L-alanine amidase